MMTNSENFRLGEQALAENRLDDAFLYFVEATYEPDQATSALVKLSEVVAQEGDLLWAIHFLQQAIYKDPRLSTELSLKIQQLTLVHEIENEMINRVFDLVEKKKQAQQRVVEKIQEKSHQLASRMLSKVIKRVPAIIKKKADNDESIRKEKEKAALAFKAEKYEKALEIYESMIEKDAKNAEAYIKAGECCLSIAKAAKHKNQVQLAKLNAMDAPSMYEIKIVFTPREKSFYDKAEAYLRSGISFLAEGQKKEREAAYKILAAVYDSSYGHRQALVCILEAYSGDIEKTFAYYETLIEAELEQRDFHLVFRYFLLLNNKDYEQYCLEKKLDHAYKSRMYSECASVYEAYCDKNPVFLLCAIQQYVLALANFSVKEGPLKKLPLYEPLERCLDLLIEDEFDNSFYILKNICGLISAEALESVRKECIQLVNYAIIGCGPLSVKLGVNIFSLVVDDKDFREPRNAVFFFQMGLKCNQEAKLDLAILCFKEVLKRDPEHSGSKRNLDLLNAAKAKKEQKKNGSGKASYFETSSAALYKPQSDGVHSLDKDTPYPGKN